MRCVFTVADVRALALTLPRTTEHLVYDRVTFQVKQIVYCAFIPDETLMGFAFPKEERDALVAAEPAVYLLPGRSNLRFNWVFARLARLDVVTSGGAGQQCMGDVRAEVPPPRAAGRTLRRFVERPRMLILPTGCEP